MNILRRQDCSLFETVAYAHVPVTTGNRKTVRGINDTEAKDCLMLYLPQR